MNEAAQHNRRLIVCVDDFGLNDEVDASVLALAAQGRISATACLVDGPSWARNAERLQREAGGRIDLGLHLNLSEAFPGAPPPLSWHALVLRAYARALSGAALRAEIARQLDAFERRMGRPPDFVDGHRHVHQLPVVRRALVEELARRYRGPRPWVRRCAAPRTDAGERFKVAVIAALGSAALARLARRAGLRQNGHLLGVYGFEGDAPAHEQRLARWLAAAEDGDLLMCHTAIGQPAAGEDGIAAARVVEHQVLAGEAFGRLLATRNVEIARGSRVLA